MSTPQVPEREEELRLTFLEHLAELRVRLIRGLLALVVCSGIGYYYAPTMLIWLKQNTVITALHPADHFFTLINLAVAAGILLSLPYLLYQIWGFIAPGLYKKEKRYALPVVCFASGFFYAGFAFSLFIVVPLILNVLPAFSGGMIEDNYRATWFVKFYITMGLAFGVAFNTPVVITLLSLLRVVDTKSMTRARPYLVVAMFALSAFLTPPDVISQLMMGVPLWFLFEAGIVVAKIIEWRRRKEASA